MEKNLIQQGDVLFFEENNLPESIKKVKSKNGYLIFAEGETTGHFHGVLEEDACELFEDEHGTLWCKVAGEIDVKHQEHKPVTLKEGVYRIGIVREVDPFAEEIRSVRD